MGRNAHEEIPSSDEADGKCPPERKAGRSGQEADLVVYFFKSLLTPKGSNRLRLQPSQP